MCGIAGIFQLDGQKVERATIDRFAASLAHRGPDGQGVLHENDGRLALGHRRLAILDLTAAAEQPMTSTGGRYVITYNGEVYNFIELRAELEQKGFRFRSESDTEVVLAAFEQWGPDCMLRFNGMWSFAIWDRVRRSLFLARDRFGVKPLYFTDGTKRFAFASELKAFLHLDGFDPAANVGAVQARLAGVSDLSEQPLLRGVESLRPGHFLEVSTEGVKRRRWWNTLDHLVETPAKLDKQAEEFRELIFDACSLRVRSDVPAATLLSGGLDSSSVLCSLAAVQRRGGAQRLAPEWRHAFIASFPGTNLDETPDAALSAERAGAFAVVHPFSGAQLSEHVDSYLYQYEEIGGLFGLASWSLYREMRNAGILVSLEGHGGDELLAGYDLHILLGLLRSRGFITAPGRTLDLIETFQKMYAPNNPEQPRGKVALAALTIPGIRAVAQRVTPSQRTLADLLRRHSFDPAAANDASARNEEQAIDALGPINGALYRSFHRQSLPRILRNFDVYSMGHGIESRMPLLDWRVVCYAFSVPDESKAGGGYTKRLLREAMRDILPEAVRLRRVKLGFNAPIADWLSRGLEGWIWDVMNEAEFLRSELWDGRALLELARVKRQSKSPWQPSEMRRATLAATAHWWQTRWLQQSSRSNNRK